MAPAASVVFEPWDIHVEAERGETLLSVGSRADVDIEALCGGKGVCGTCTVQVRDGMDNLSPVSEQERTVLEAPHIEDGHRLACRATVQGDVTVFVPDASRSEGGIIMTEGAEVEFDIDPAVRNYHVEIPAPTLVDNTGDRDRLIEGIEETYGRSIDALDRLTLRDLPTNIRGREVDGSYSVTGVVYENDELLSVRPGRVEAGFGLAIDIGTTTVAVYLVDLRTGDVESVSSRLNPQHQYGGDIISRVQHATSEEGGRAELQREIVDGVNESIAEVMEDAGVSREAIYEAVFVGNTAMHHLFLGIDAGAVAASPYVPATHGDVRYKARELGIDIHESAYLYWLPVIGGWVGPDFVADLLTADVLDREETTVVIDIGTNGEIAVHNGDQTWVASAPAGPALEGAEISNGMRARPGAIETVSIDPDTHDPSVGVIDDQEPVGICGSGILDAVAQLFLVGAINERGRLQNPKEWDRIREDEQGNREFVLVYGSDSATGEDISVSQEDVRDIQNAKAAIQTGTRILMAEAGVEEIDSLVMAGGFGNHIDPRSAKLLGLYPEIDVDDVEFLGNAAGYGAMYTLLNRDARGEARRIVEEVEYVELAASDTFHDEFMQAMYLPHRDFDLYPNVQDTVRKAQE